MTRAFSIGSLEFSATLSHTHTHRNTLGHTHTLTHLHTQTLSHAHTHRDTFTIYVYITHTHTHTHSHKLSYLHIRKETDTLSMSLKYTISRFNFYSTGANWHSSSMTFTNAKSTLSNYASDQLWTIDMFSLVIKTFFSID